MKTEKYFETLSNGSGHLNPYAVKTSDNSPEYGGYIKIDDKIYRVAAWIKKSKNGVKRLSLAIREFDIDSECEINSL